MFCFPFSFSVDYENHPLSFPVRSFLFNLVTVHFCVVSKEPPKTRRYTVLYEITKHSKTIPICPFKYYLFLL